ncbi:hypothetical protein Scep_002633 [Stephania cephalantha]|uniref:Uncharacterized protein n=1 Tax=Stephania cephalantha TaxID=152367 RepID=A0AAP0LA91_9MAGN
MRRWRDSHHGSREFVRWGSDDLRRPSVIVRWWLPLSSRSPGFWGSSAASCREEERKRRVVLGPPRYWEATEVLCPWRRATKESFTRETERRALKKEKKLKGDKKFDKGREDELGGRAGACRRFIPGRDREMKEFGIRGSADLRRQLTTKALLGMRHAEKGHELESLLIFCLAKQLSYNPQPRFFGRGCQREVARSEVDTARAILGQAYAAITNSEEILFAAIQTESRHGNKKESNIPMARRKTLFVGRKRFTNLSKLTRVSVADKYKDSTV